RRGGVFHMAQLWVNLPKAHKMDPPNYQPIIATEIAEAPLPDGAGAVRIIAGEYGGKRGPAKTFTPIDLFDVRLTAGSRWPVTLPEGHNTAILVMRGGTVINGSAAKEEDFVIFEQAPGHIVVEAQGETQLLVMSGEPI